MAYLLCTDSMAPPKKIVEKSESSNKRMNLSQTLPDDVIEHILSTFVPIHVLVKTRVLSKRFEKTEMRSRNLDFSGVFSSRRSQKEAVDIVEKVFNQHKGLDIHRLVLCINNSFGIADKTVSWINKCIDKGVKELNLNLYNPFKIMYFTVDFSAIKTLEILTLVWCRIEIPNSPKGLRLLRELSLTRTTNLTSEMINAIFRNCIHLESVQLNRCGIVGILRINAQNHKKFKTLAVSYMEDLTHIIVAAPTLEHYIYDGYVINVHLLATNALEDAILYYYHRKNQHDHISSDLLIAHMGVCTRVSAFSTTAMFLGALIKRYRRGRILEKKRFSFENLTKFAVAFKSPTFCTLFDIAEFLSDCPKLEQVTINIKGFRFQRHRLQFWEMHHKDEVENKNYELKFLKEVKIIGYKGHSHELDIIKFFVKNAPSLEKLELRMIKKNKNAHTPDNASIDFVKSIFPVVDVTEFYI